MIGVELNPSRDSVEHLRSLTGLRFLAALAVFVSHVREYLLAGLAPLPLGGPAVSFFFVLSGFILTHVYDGRLQHMGVRRFFATRLARLWPLHASCLALCLWLTRDFVLGDPLHPEGVLSFLAQLFLVHAWIPVEGWMFGFNSVSWSISTEFFFYLSFPLFLRVSRRNCLVLFFLVLGGALGILAAVDVWQAGGGSSRFLDWPAAAICHPFVRLPEFLLGVVVCRFGFLPAPGAGARPAWTGNATQERDARPALPGFWTSTVLEVLVVAAVIVPWIVIVRLETIATLDRLTGPVWATWLRVASGMFVFAAVILVFARCRGLLSRFLACSLMVWLGEISYAFYLVHQIFIRYLHHRMLDGWATAGLAFLLSLFASAMLYRLVETPGKAALLSLLDRRARRVPGKTMLARGLYGTFTSRRGLLQFTGLAIAIGLVALARPSVSDRAEIQRIIDATPEHLRNVQFKDEAILLGYEVERGDRGRMVRLVWQLEASHSRSRFIHVTSEEGEVISQLPLKQLQVADAMRGKPFVESVWVSNERLYRSSRIGVGFWSAESGAARVTARSKGVEVGMNGYRLEIDEIKPRNWK